MKEIFEIAKKNTLFNEIQLNDFDKMFECINAWSENYKKDEIIFFTGDKYSYIGLILEGGVKIVKEDIEGNPMILTELKETELFGEVFACAEMDFIPVTVQATQNSRILFFDYKKVIANCSKNCQFHNRLIRNMLSIMAKKNLILNRKIEILAQRSIREKILFFFNNERNGKQKFTIPYNREEMARYLCVDRSAMSKELCKMRNEGLLRFKKNEFEIVDMVWCNKSCCES